MSTAPARPGLWVPMTTRAGDAKHLGTELGGYLISMCGRELDAAATSRAYRAGRGHIPLPDCCACADVMTGPPRRPAFL